MKNVGVTTLTPDLKLYHVVACTVDGDSLDWNVLATDHQDALDRLIEFRARGFFGRPHGPISRQAIADEDWDCDGIQNREGPEVVVWEVRVSRADPVTGCIPWDSLNNGDKQFLPDVLASLQRRNALI
ncbi:hypothetical protein CHELA1G11_40077 [Hyphomicrobiales bacterium]|nr:hypothetical protein CHELA1G2_40064 [Hyphomicrobiales bacterium]CAH1696483.1 hypothetical protein CHELA1G11_40077 [Hyphomicrobiales bacterium]